MPCMTELSCTSSCIFPHGIVVPSFHGYLLLYGALVAGGPPHAIILPSPFLSRHITFHAWRISVAPLCFPHVVMLGSLCHAEIFKYFTYNVKTSFGTSSPLLSPCGLRRHLDMVDVSMLPCKRIE